MSIELKKIPVKSQEEAFRIITALGRQYDMHQDPRRHQFHVSNDHYSAYYDEVDQAVKLEVIHPEQTTAEEIEEFLMGFPTFF